MQNLPHSFKWLDFCSPPLSEMLLSLIIFVGTVSSGFGTFANRMVAAALSIAPCWTRLFFKWCGVSLCTYVKNAMVQMNEKQWKINSNVMVSMCVLFGFNCLCFFLYALTVYAIWSDAIFQPLHFPIHFSRDRRLPYWIWLYDHWNPVKKCSIKRIPANKPKPTTALSIRTSVIHLH